VVKIYRDPTNDLAILKITASGLPVAELGDSDKIKVGQLAIAIGTALGEFRHTVTTGVISGVGRGLQPAVLLKVTLNGWIMSSRLMRLSIPATQAVHYLTQVAR